MSSLHVSLEVKFRALFVTWRTFKQSWTIPLPVPVPLPHAVLLKFNDRGVNLLVELR